MAATLQAGGDSSHMQTHSIKFLSTPGCPGPRGCTRDKTARGHILLLPPPFHTMANTFGITRETIAILDFGSQYSHIIARRVRELNVYCEMHSCLVEESVLRACNLKGIILSGGPFSVYEEGAPHMQQGIWRMAEELGLPILGICYGFQEMAHQLGGSVVKAPTREFGHASVLQAEGLSDAGAAELLAGVPGTFTAWMSHGDKIQACPPGFVTVASTPDCEFTAAASTGRPNRLFGLQFHPEVAHTPQGKDILGNFVVRICGAKQDWSMASFCEGECAARAGMLCGTPAHLASPTPTHLHTPCRGH
jgi:GMP synthase (glutamine-hydrolysing)